MKRTLLIVAATALSFAHLAACAWLYQVHLDVYGGGVSEGLFCGGAAADCEAVASHPSSSILGLPLPIFGLCYSALMIGLLGSALAFRDADRLALLGIAAVFASLACAFDAYLAIVMATEVGRWCALCAATYALNVGSAVLLWRLCASDGRGVPWSEAWPRWRDFARGDEPVYYRNMLKTGALVLTFVAVGSMFRLARMPLSEIREWGEREVARLVDRMHAEKPDVDMSRFQDQPFQGAPDARVQLVVVGDFQCSLCRSLAAKIEELRSHAPADVSVRYVSSPLDCACNAAIPEAFHPHACWLARASECAHAAGRFWEFHRLVYSVLRHGDVGPEAVLAHAAELGLDPSTFAACIESTAAKEAVARDVALCAATSLTTTPSLVINGYVKRGTVFPWMLDEIVSECLARPAAPKVAREP